MNIVKKPSKYIALVALPLFALLVSCHHLADDGGDAERIAALHQLDDSLSKQSPASVALIEKGMRQAKDSLTYYEYYAHKARWFCQSSTPDSTVDYVDRTLAFALQQPETPRCNGLLAYAYNTQGVNFHNFHRKTDDAITVYQLAYRYAMRSDVLEQAPNICANLGDAYVFNNQLVEAVSWYRRALFLVDSLQLPKESYASLQVGLADIYVKLHDFESALKCYRESEKLFSRMSLSMKAYSLNNYGTYYYYRKDYPNCLRKFRQLEQLLLANGKNDCFDMYLCKLNMADVYLNMDSISQSVQCLAECEPYFEANRDVEAMFYCNTIRIGQDVKRGNMPGVKATLARERQLLGSGFDRRAMFNMRQIRNQYLQQYYIATGDYRLAYETLRNDILVNDSLEHNTTNLRASEIMNRFAQDTLRLHHDLAIEHKNVELGQMRFVALVVTMFFVLVCMIFVVKSMRSAKRLEVSKQRILQLKLDGARNRISPHFVFNVLNNKILHTDAADAQELMDLVQLIRSNLDLSCKMNVTLATELEFVKKYLAVERPLMGDDFTFAFELDADVDPESVHIPSMFVQILVENALVHGLKGWEGKKVLRITVSRQPTGGTLVAVHDNGRGFDIRNKRPQRTGLNIITQTLAVVNARNRNKMTFALKNRKADDGSIAGCTAQVYIPDGMQM